MEDNNSYNEINDNFCGELVPNIENEKNTIGSASGNEEEKENKKPATITNNNTNNECIVSTVKITTNNPYKTNWISSERLNELRKMVQEAIKNHRVFTMRGAFHTVRRVLVDRGWVEKLDGLRVKPTASSASTGFILEDFVQHLPQRRPGESRRNFIAKCERSIMSRFLEHSAVDFLWTVRREKADWIDMMRNQSMIINRFCKVPFTSKEGLCTALREFHWFYEEGMSETYFPRCFNVWNPEELNEFIDNFRLTSCISLLRWLVETYQKSGLSGIASDEGNVSTNCINFAFSRCQDYLDCCLHNDIDTESDTKVWEHDWDVFLTHHYLVTHESGRILLTKEEKERKSIESYIEASKKILEQIKKHWPQYNMDGFLNIWIVKVRLLCKKIL